MSDDKLRSIVKDMLDKGYSREDIDKVVTEFRSRQATTAYAGDEDYNPLPEIPKYNHVTVGDIETNIGDGYFKEENASEYLTNFYRDQDLDVRFVETGAGKNELVMLVGQERIESSFFKPTGDAKGKKIKLDGRSFEQIQQEVALEIDSRFNKEKTNNQIDEVLERLPDEYSHIFSISSDENLFGVEDNPLGMAKFAHALDQANDVGSKIIGDLIGNDEESQINALKLLKFDESAFKESYNATDDQISKIKESKKYIQHTWEPGVDDPVFTTQKLYTGGNQTIMMEGTGNRVYTSATHRDFGSLAELISLGEYEGRQVDMSGGIELKDGSIIPFEYIWRNRELFAERLDIQGVTSILEEKLEKYNGQDGLVSRLKDNAHIEFENDPIRLDIFNLRRDLEKEVDQDKKDDINNKIRKRWKQKFPDLSSEELERLLLFDDNGNYLGIKPHAEYLEDGSEEQQIEESANILADTVDTDGLTNRWLESYAKLIHYGKLSHLGASELLATDFTREPGAVIQQTIGELFDFSNDAVRKDLAQLKKLYEINDIYTDTPGEGLEVAGGNYGTIAGNVSGKTNKTLSVLPGNNPLATQFNSALLEYKTLSRALLLNENINNNPEEVWWKHTLNGLGKAVGGEGIIDSQTNDEYKATFKNVLESDGYDVPDHVIEGNFGLNPLKWSLGTNTVARSRFEGSSDVITGLAPLLIELAAFKKVGGLKAIKGGVNKLNKRIFPNGIKSPIGRKIVNNAVIPGVITTLEWSGAELAGEQILGYGDTWQAHTINTSTGEFNWAMPFAMGAGGTIFAKSSSAIKENLRKNPFINRIFPYLENPDSFLRTTRGGRILNEASSHVTKNVGAGATATSLLVVAETAQALVDELIKGENFDLAAKFSEITDTEHLIQTWLAMTVLSAKDVSPRIRRQFREEVSRLTRNKAKVTEAQNNLKVNDKSSEKEINEAAQKKIDEWKNFLTTKEGIEREVKKVKEQHRDLMVDFTIREARTAAIERGKYYEEFVVPRWKNMNNLRSRPATEWTLEDFDNIGSLKHNELYSLLRENGIEPGTKAWEGYEKIHDAVTTISSAANLMGFKKNLPKWRQEYIDFTLKTAANENRIKELKENIKNGQNIAKSKAELKQLEETNKKLYEDSIVKFGEAQKELNVKMNAEVALAKAVGKKIDLDIGTVERYKKDKDGNIVIDKKGNKVETKEWEKLDKEKRESEGWFITDKSGRSRVMLNMSTLRQTKNLGAPMHEVVHAVLKNHLKDSSGKISKEGIQIIDGLMQKFSLKDRKVIEKRIDENYKYYEKGHPREGEAKEKKDYYEEYITSLSDAIKNKEITYNRETFSNVGKTIFPIIKKYAPKLYKEKGTYSEKAVKDLYEFLGDIQNIRDISVQNRIIEFAKKEPNKTVDMAMSAYSKSTSKFKEPVNKIGEKIGKEINGKKYTTEDAIIELYGENILQNLISLKLKPFEKVPGISYEDMIAGTIAESMAHIRGFKPEMKIEGTEFGLYGHIESQLRNKIGNVLKTGKGATKAKFDEQIGGEKFKDIEDKGPTAEEMLDAKIAAEAAVETAPNLRKSLVNEKGEPYVKEPIIKEIENAVVKTLGTKLPEVSTKEFKSELQTSFKNFLKKPIADMMGKRSDFDSFLLSAYPAIKKHMPVDFFVKLERLKKPEDRIFTTEEKRLTKQEEVRDAIDKGKLDPNVSETAGNKLYSKKDFSYNNFYNFFRGKDVGASTKGTRKDALAEGMGVEFAFDMTMEVAKRPEVMEKRREINNRTSEQARLEISEMAKRINRDPNIKFAKNKLEKYEDAVSLEADMNFLLKEVISKGREKVWDKKGRLLDVYKDKNISKFARDFVLDLENRGLIYPEVHISEAIAQQKYLQTLSSSIRSGSFETIPIQLGIKHGKKYGLEMLTKQVAEGGIPDFHAAIHGNPFNVEVKMFDSQLPRNAIGESLNFSTGKHSFKGGSLYDAQFQRMIKSGEKARKEWADYVLTRMQANGIKIKEITNKTKIPSEIFLEAQKLGLQAKTTVVESFENGLSYVRDKYLAKKLKDGTAVPNHYIEVQSIKGKELGLYTIGDFNPLGLKVPKLDAKMDLRMRFSASSSTPIKAPKGYEGFHKVNQKYYSASMTFIPTMNMKSISKSSPYSITVQSKFMNLLKSPEFKRLEKINPKETTDNINKNIQNILGIKYSKSSKKELINDMRSIDAAVNLGRLTKKKKKGISVWDFDDTLARTKSGVLAQIPNPSGKPMPKRKVIFMAGGPGAGKSTAIKGLGLEKQGFKIVNQDISLQWLAKNHGLPTNMREFTPEQSSKWGTLTWEARDIMKRKKIKFQGKGDGIVVDGTGASLKSMEAQRMEFLRKGYDVSMVFVETSLPTALARNRARKERSLKDSIVERTWKSVMKNKNSFTKIFGKNFIEIKADKLKMGDALPKEVIAKADGFTKSYEKRRLTAEEFASRGKEILDRGGKFDFSEFTQVREGQPGPFFEKFTKRMKKYGPKDNFVLTARPPESAPNIQMWLKMEGYEIPLENIKALGNSTAEAKALWMLKKFEEGYNDFYFADDALANVKEVKNVLEQLDVKSKVQQAKFSKNKNLSKEFNEILENKFNVEAHKKYSEAKARLVGAKKGKFKFWGSPGAEDFSGLITYAFSGKGKKGEAQKQWFDDVLHRPYNRAYNDIHARKQNISNDYKHLRKTMPEVRKRLNETVDGVYTVEQAMRVHLWDKAGFKVPGLSKTDLKTLTDYVRKDKDLTLFSETLSNITMLKEGYLKPSEHWLGENITIDLNNVVDKVYRKEALAEFMENRETVFGKWDPTTGRLIGPNMNKIEAIKGPRHREAIENMIWRMENMTNRSRGTDGVTNTWMNWVNNATGTIMFFNQKSAMLQTISTINYTNGTWNNPLRAGRAFANQPQYWKDFSKIWNSDMMVQRRAGLKINVEANEILERVSGSKNKASAALAYLLQKGFIPTKYADSFAIASGGATFYRNRIKYYEKQGLSAKKAETKAWEDFTLFTEKTQQSSRPDLISMQQASALGRPILAFANTPMQMFRRHKRRIQDIANRRGNTAENVASSLYYGAVQTMIFSYLANAMFAVDHDSEDEDDIKHAEKQKSRYLQTIVDSYLRGMGLTGAVPSALKNGILRFNAENKKDFNADYGNVVIDMLNVSPPIGSKARKIYSATKTWKYNKEVIPEMGIDFDNPGVMAVANVISALTNVPTDRAVMKAQNIRDASMGDFETWQRISMFMGINKWQLGIGDEGPGQIRVGDVEARLDTEKKEKKKVEKEIKKQEEFKVKEQEGVEKQKREKKEGKQVTCLVCKLPVQKGKKYCTIHEKKEQRKDGKKVQCRKTKSDFTRCKVMTTNKSGYCYYHD